MQNNRKNGALIFLFAFIPGAGQMYQGYMKRGLSLISMFCFGGMLAAIFSYGALVLPIIWMYSFFDTLNLKSNPIPLSQDDYLVSKEWIAKGKKFIQEKPNTVGVGLVLLGAWTLFDTFIAPLLSSLAILSGRQEIYYYNFYRNIPTLIVSGILIYVGFRLANQKSDTLQDFEEFKGEDKNDESIE